MSDEAMAARYDYAAQVGRQSLQMLRVAAQTDDRGVRDELLAYADRMAAHAQWLWNGLHPDGVRPVFRWSLDDASIAI